MKKSTSSLIRIARATLLALWVLPLGCSRTDAALSGTVTYDGKPVENGQITFTPVDGQGQPVGAPIRNGKYKISSLIPGPNIVKIEAVNTSGIAMSNEEMKRRAQSKKSGEATVETGNLIPASAEGNNTQVEVAAGSKTLDFHLKKPTHE